MIDNQDIQDDLAEMRMMEEERQLRCIEALTNMENGHMTLEDKQVIWYECGLTRSAFVKRGMQ